MASVEISTACRGNQYLKDAMEAADSQGKNAYNNKLDSNEIVTFIQEAKKSDKCNMTDVLSIVNQVGVDKGDKTTLNKLQQLEEINKIENNIKTLKAELKKRKYTLDQKEYKIASTATCLAGLGGFFGGAWAGLKAGAAISAAFPAASPVIIPVAAIGGAIVGSYAAYTAADYAQRPFESHETTVQRKEAENYKNSNVKPLEAKIKALEELLETKLSKFYE